MRRPPLLLTLLLLALWAGVPVQATVDAGAAKWRQQDWAGAVAAWTTPAARGDADALFNMGQAYRLGRGVPLNRATALEYYRRAADKGHVAATANLGITLWQEGRKTDALGYLRQASDRGDIRAVYVLGVATFTGDGAPRNPALGYAYVLRARDGGLAPASAQAARMATLLTPDDRARGEAAASALAAGRPTAVAFANVSRSASAAAVPAARSAQPGAAGEDAGTDASEDGIDDPTKDASKARTAAAAEQPPEAPRARRNTASDRRTAEKPATEKPAAEKAAAEKAAKTEDPSRWKVQLGAYANERAARTAWATLVSQSAAMLKGQTPIYSERGNLVRLQLGPFDARADAGSLCTKLAAAGRPCFITRG